MTRTRTRHRRRTTMLLTILITSVVALGAIGAAWAFGWSLAENATAPTPSAAATNQPYVTSAELVAAIKAAGVTCAGFRVSNAADISRDGGTCGTESAGELVITIYANPEDRKAVAQAFMSGNLPRQMILVGPNWTVYGPAPVIEVLTDKLGGTRYSPVR